MIKNQQWNSALEELQQGEQLLKTTINERVQTANKIQKFLSSMEDKADDRGAYKASYDIHQYYVKATRIELKLDDIKNNNYRLGLDITELENSMYFSEMLASQKPHGATEREKIITKRTQEENHKKINAEIKRLQQQLQKAFDDLKGTEVHFDENMFTSADLKQIISGETTPAKKTKLVKVEEVTIKHAISSKKPQDKKTFFSTVKSFLIDSAAKVKSVIIHAAKKVTKKAQELKEVFFSKMKTFLKPII